MKNCNDTNWKRTGDLPICSTAPQLNNKLQIADICNLHTSYSSCYGWRSGHDEMYFLYIKHFLHWVMYLHQLTL